MAEESRNALVLIFQNKGDVQSWRNDRGIKLMIHTRKMWEKVVEASLRRQVIVSMAGSMASC